MGNAVDAVVVGSGPNGLAAALTLARAGLRVDVYEADDEIGGGCRTEHWGEGFLSDWGSAVHPMAIASPFFRGIGLAEHVDFVVPDISFAHVLDGRAVLAWRSLERTSEELGRDGAAWRRLVEPLSSHIDGAVRAALGSPLRMAAAPVDAARLARAAVSARLGAALHTTEARALLAGVTAHSVHPQPRLGVSAAAVVLAALGHSVGWPVPVGGSGTIVSAVARELRALGGVLHTGRRIRDIRELPRARAYFFDTSGADLLRIAGDRVSAGYARALRRMRPGNAVSKVDLVLTEPIPWRDARLAQAGTVHLGGQRGDIRRAEADVHAGRHAADPMIVLSQPSLFDGTRAPGAAHVVWAYAHVPAHSPEVQTENILRAVERHAPGVRDLVVASRATTAADIASRNPTMVGGDFASGALSTRQVLARPRLHVDPWRAGRDVYLCSASTAPGPGVHGMAGAGAAQSALRRMAAGRL